MSSYRQLFLHIVFGTKNREPTINPAHETELYKYIWGVVKRNNSVLHQLNGMPDHIHILSDLHPTISLSNYIKDIKVSSSIWMKESGKFPLFRGWAEGYGVFSCAERDKENVVRYIKNQKEHHRKIDYREEYIRLLEDHKIKYDDKYLF